MSVTSAYLLVGSIGLVIVGLTWAERKQYLKVNRTGLAIAVWITIGYLLLNMVFKPLLNFSNLLSI